MFLKSRVRRSVRLVTAVCAAALVVGSCAAAPPDDNSQTGVGSTPGSTPGGAPVPAPPPNVRPPVTQPVTTYVAKGDRLGIGNCPVLPNNNVFHADITTLPVLANSAAIVRAAGAQVKVRPAFSAGVHEGSRGGLPINIVDSSKMKQSTVFSLLHGPVDLGQHPIPQNPRIEGYPGIAWDQHMLLFDTATCNSHEFFLVRPPTALTDFWWADSGVQLDMRSNEMNKGSATASGFSMLAGMVRYDEVTRGSINHAVGFAFPTISKLSPVWPASGSDGKSNDPNAPRMGMMFRLRSDVDLNSLAPTARLIAKAMQTHGAILSDSNHEGIALAGENDDRWDDADLATLSKLTMADFEVVDPTPMKVADDSYAVR
ncbi:MAG: hypothetical protein WBA45_06240 [Microthrixaceae bacterium]